MKSSSAGWTVELTGHSNSAHIAKLVAQQKPKDTRRRRKRSGRNQRNSNNSSRQYDSRPRPQPNSSINRYRYRPQYSSPEYREPATFSSDRRHNTQCQYMIPAGFESDTSESIEWPTNKNTGDKQPVRSTSCSSTINLPPAINSTPKATPIPCKKLSRLDVLRNMLNELKLKENSKLKPPPSPQVLSSGSDNETAVARARPPITVPVKPQNIDCNLDAQLLAKKSPTKHVEPVTKLWHESSDDDSFTEAMFTISHVSSFGCCQYNFLICFFVFCLRTEQFSVFSWHSGKLCRARCRNSTIGHYTKCWRDFPNRCYRNSWSVSVLVPIRQPIGQFRPDDAHYWVRIVSHAPL